MTRWLSFIARHGLTAALAAGTTWYAVAPAKPPPVAVVAKVEPVKDERVCSVCGSQAGTRLHSNPPTCSICISPDGGFNLIEGKTWMSREAFVNAVLAARIGNMELDATKKNP